LLEEGDLLFRQYVYQPATRQNLSEGSCLRQSKVVQHEKRKMTSPYIGLPATQWADVTHALVQAHPLTPAIIHDAAQASWQRLWSTTVGDAALGFPLVELDPPAMVVGYFFEKLFAKELAIRLPGHWRGGVGSEKDLHCLSDIAKSVEMKASGQLGYKVYGNRSYGQQIENADAAKKDKSGYYITINFYRQTLTLLRFGWIDAEDWRAQRSATGQMAGLGDDVYNLKLLPIQGRYRLSGPVELVTGVGSVAGDGLRAIGIHSIDQLISAQNLPPNYARLQAAARAQYEGCY